MRERASAGQPAKVKAEVTATEEYLLSIQPVQARLVKQLVRETNVQKKARLAAKAGEYRVIHGSVNVPIPLSERLLPDGSENEHLPKQVLAMPGDVVWLNDRDALALLETDVVEPMDARPSRVGQPSENEKATRAEKAWDYATVKANAEARAARAV
jgi:hypothetical protein